MKSILLSLFSVLLLILMSSSASAEEKELFRHNYLNQGETLSLIPGRVEIRSVSDYGIEMLYEFPGRGEIDWEDLYFRLRSISRLEEVVYYSEYAGKYRKMFPRAYVMESERRKTRMPDYDEDTLFADAEIFAFLDEAELKDGRYRVNYNVSPGSIQIQIQNITALRRFIKLVDREDFYLNFLFFAEDGRLNVYIYGAFSLKNEFIVLKLLKYPSSTLAKRVYTIFSSLIGDFHGADLPVEFPDYLRE